MNMAYVKRRDGKRQSRSISSKRYDVQVEEVENILGSVLPKNPKREKRKNNGSLIIINKVGRRNGCPWFHSSISFPRAFREIRPE